MKRFFKRGSAEIVSVVLMVVVLGGVALAVSASLSNQTTKSAKTGLKANTTQLEKTYNNIESQLTELTD